MRDEPPTRVPVPRGRQVRIGDPDEREWPLAGSLARLGVGFLCAFLSPVLVAAIGGTSPTQVVAVFMASIGLGFLFAVRRVARYLRISTFVEFDGLVIRQWHRERNEVDEYCVAFDDGRRPTAWAFMVSHELYLDLRPGMRVHVQMNERRNRPIRVEVVEETWDAVG